MSYSTAINAQQLLALQGQSNLFVLDCRFDLGNPERGAELYSQGHIPGAQYVDLNRELSSKIIPGVTGRHPLPSIESLQVLFSRLGIDSQAQVVVYDDCNGAMAARTWWLLRWLGHESVALLEGGIQAWQALAELTTDIPSVSVSQFEVKPSRFALVDIDQVAALNEQQLLVDARAAARYRGEMEPIDPVAGHVPGAANRPFQENLDSNGQLLPAEQLAEQWQSLAEGRQLVHMCGSGVTGCLNLLAMEQAGLTNHAMYIGSWSEWIADGKREVATGE